jgi:succinoglycan biosynthesis protein ExoV
MHLYYFKDPQGNFGDDLNPWLWRRLIPELVGGAADDEWFIGIGTLLNQRLPAAPVKHVFGSGYGYGEPPRLDGRWVVHAVRGYETARVLGLARDRVITDAAVLVRSVQRPRAAAADCAFGFMPHCQSSRCYDWDSVCRELGIHYISAEWDVERVLFEMSRCQTLLCEAMHGAIVADSLRIPWIPVACYDHIAAFKWRDWLSTLELPYSPHVVPPLYDAERTLSVATRWKNCVKRYLRAAGWTGSNWTDPPPRRTGAAQRERALDALSAASRARSFLSSDRLVQRHTERYLERVDALRRRPALPARADTDMISSRLNWAHGATHPHGQCVGDRECRDAVFQRSTVHRRSLDQRTQPGGAWT